jgi:hypothetical protein
MAEIIDKAARRQGSRRITPAPEKAYIAHTNNTAAIPNVITIGTREPLSAIKAIEVLPSVKTRNRQS